VTIAGTALIEWGRPDRAPASFNSAVRPWVAGVAGICRGPISAAVPRMRASSPLPHAAGQPAIDRHGRGVIGYAPGPYWLVYGTAATRGILCLGFARGRGGTSLLSGWTAGAGIEALIAQNLSVKFEYLHVDLGHAGVRRLPG